MSKNDIYAISKDDGTAGGGVKPLANPTAAASAATVTPTDTKTTVTPSQPVTPTVTHPAAGYVGSDYSDWHKHYSGTEWDGSSPMMAKPDWMSTADYQRGMVLYRYGQESDKIQGDYDAAVGAADVIFEKAEDAYRSEMAYNGVLYERMKKYMPLQQKRAGMGNMGIAQTGLAQITNDHMNRRSAIQGQYNDASFARAAAVGAAERARANSMSDLNALTSEELFKIYAGEEADAEEKQQAEIDAFMENLDIHGDAETAVAAFKNTLSKDDPRFSQYETKIRGYFTNKTNAETKQVADRAYTTLYDILTSDATKEEIDKIWNEHARIIPTMTADQQATLNSLYSVSGMPTKTELAANAISMRNEVDALIAEGATTDEIDTTLAGWKKKVTEDEYKNYFSEVEKAKKSEKYLLAAAKARGANGINYANEIILQEGANKYTNGDVDAYIEDVLAGKVEVAEGIEIKNDKALNDNFLQRPVFVKALQEQTDFDSPFDKNIPNGTVVMTMDTGKGLSYEDFGSVDVSNPYNYIPGVAIYNWIAEIGTLPKISNKKDAYVYFDGAWYPAKVKK